MKVFLQKNWKPEIGKILGPDHRPHPTLFLSIGIDFFEILSSFSINREAIDEGSNDQISADMSRIEVI